MNDGKLSREYFDLIRDALHEEKNTGGSASNSPRKRRKLRSYQQEEEPKDAKDLVVITIDSSDEGEKSQSENEVDYDDEEEDDEYDSEDFEDVTDAPADDGTLSITINTAPERKTARKKKSGTGLDPKIREFRKSCHMFMLITLMCHSYQRNEWCNDERLQKRLSKLVPDETFNNLHPPKDEEMPLRSTRKLLDALRMLMKHWNKKFKLELTSSYELNHLYMVHWDSVLKNRCERVTFKTFKRFFTKMRGPCNISVQGFVTMLRGCGLNARLVHSLQAPDFTDTKVYTKRVDWSLENECLKYPIYWCEVWDKFAKQWITVDIVGKEIIEQVRYKSKLEPVGRIHSAFNMMRYVIAFDRKQGTKDVSRRYIAQLQNKVRKKRITRDAKLNEWYQEVIERLNKRSRNRIDDYEEEYFELRNEHEGIPDSLQDIKNHPFYVLEKDLRANQVLKSGAQHCGFLRLRNKSNSLLKVYSRKDVISCYSARHWYMQGRSLKTGAQHLLTHKIKNTAEEDEEDERLYPVDQTEFVIPKQVAVDGTIPTNFYGNIDVYKPWMIPIGCCLVENPNSIKAASLLRIPFAKAVTGFKFESGRRVKPKISGVVVENEYVDALIAVIQYLVECNEENAKHELELEALNGWSLLLTKLRIKSRLVEEHGVVSDDGEDRDVNSEESDGRDIDRSDSEEDDEGEDMGGFEKGGFLLDSAAEGGFVPEPQLEQTESQEIEPELPTAHEEPSPNYEEAETTRKDDVVDEFEQFLQEVQSQSDDDGSFQYESE
ncbi:unnamed protein product [Kluyveromyces dobzhanskii CBS 2104]|uniref:WGS project CCBQ000000000 data, contig 00010 n=1 Tax=Kluyveromyces dobzhanskii CBS 2104 TaxID=1427455 RepID=A0A0A8LCU0_9SACH|nr:unnamed protein product [Kluyveromyces dobzhanskii CBS 2104]